MDFDGKVVLITGASSGIGAAAAIQFARQSASLILVGRNEPNLNKIASYCKNNRGFPPITIVANLANDADIEDVVTATLGNDKLDVLVNAAGIIEMGGIKTTDVDVYDKVMAVNMRAIYKLTNLCAAALAETKGCIVNVSSILSSKASTQSLAYSVSKAALDHFTKCVALELAPDGVRVNSVNPGFVKTNMWKKAGLTPDQLDMYTENYVSKSPLHTLTEANDVADLIVYLASKKARNITGTCFTIDAGNSLK